MSTEFRARGRLDFVPGASAVRMAKSLSDNLHELEDSDGTKLSHNGEFLTLEIECSGNVSYTTAWDLYKDIKNCGFYLRAPARIQFWSEDAGWEAEWIGPTVQAIADAEATESYETILSLIAILPPELRNRLTNYLNQTPCPASSETKG